MIAFTFWIKSDGSWEPAGPLSFTELRALMQSGLVDGQTLLADDDFTYHPLRDYPDLWEALNDPAVCEAERLPSLGVLRREDVRRERDTNTAAPILNPAKEDVIDFEAVRRGERGFAAYDVLALNRSKEPEKVIKLLPWHKGSRIRDLRRWLLVSSPFVLILLFAAVRFVIRIREGADGFELAPLVALFSLSFFVVMLLWGFFFLVDYHWHGKD